MDKRDKGVIFNCKCVYTFLCIYLICINSIYKNRIEWKKGKEPYNKHEIKKKMLYERRKMCIYKVKLFSRILVWEKKVTGKG